MPDRTPGGELDLSCRNAKVRLVQPRVSLSNPKIGFGTIAAALAALSMAVLGHFLL